MQVDPTQVLNSVHGKPIRKIGIDWRDALKAVVAVASRSPGLSTTQCVEQTAQMFNDTEGVLTLGDACVEALLSSSKAGEAAPKDKIRRWDLAVQFAGTEPFNLKADAIVFVSDCLAEHYKPAIYGPAYNALNNER